MTNNRLTAQIAVGHCQNEVPSVTDSNLAKVDPLIARLVAQENVRQQEVIRLIPSENFASAAVVEATASSLANKYSEGYAYKRYYNGQANIDEVEMRTNEAPMGKTCKQTEMK